MWRFLLVLSSAVCINCKIVPITNHVPMQPEQVHIAYGDSVYEIVATWSTVGDTKESIVEYGTGFQSLNYTAAGSSRLFTDGGRKGRSQYVHSVTLKNLRPSTVYVYHVGSRFGWSNEFLFRTPPVVERWQPSLAIFGDMGLENAQSLARLEEDTHRGMYDAILHVGDFAYDMNSHNGVVGDKFMKLIEPIAAYVPYMTCVGNHEERYNFSHYKMRFNMPGDTENLMFSFNMGPLHIISISTEVYYFLNYGIKSLVFQYEWLENDLREATDPKNRRERPWIIVMGHRPMYCSNTDPADCAHNSTFTRVGIPFFHMFGLEKLFYDNKVDVLIWAHQHSYERLWPIYDFKIFNGTYEQPYLNPLAPVHIITGSAGCKENHSHFDNDKPYWSAFRSTDYGYTRMKAYNKTHLYFEQVSDDQGGAVIDSFWIIQNKRSF
ncbi:hypothetical protein PPYR_03505 [Photinus pyralis]|uniref:Purple acid phosphatase n=1 Tax=Photinus pyralis TaxID=7054 RepID=A0A5N4A302_PHOPY|nr:acid phosphatase type 7-like [Photinus pyralis]KAB0791705.1 hypothetical protein PPYR_03505 [Photinus pyralis]